VGDLTYLENEPTDDVMEIAAREPSNHDENGIAPNEPNNKFRRF
jgi:hypothetical protein